MVTDSFNSYPKSKVALRLLIPALLVFWLSMPVMEIVADRPELAPQLRVPSSLPGEAALPVLANSLSSDGSVWYLTVWKFWRAFPQTCWDHAEVNDLQRNRCQLIWNKAIIVTSIATLPFVLGWVVFLVLTDQIALFHRRLKKHLNQKSPIARAQLSNRWMVPDLFSFFYGLRKAAVRHSNGRKEVIYISVFDTVPLCGELVTLYDVGRTLGAKRVVGLHYAPHMSVMSHQRENA